MTRKKVPPKVFPPSPGYPPGHFTALVMRHNWPPRFEPRAFAIDDTYATAQRAEAARIARRNAVEQGIGWGDGTIVLPGTPKHLRPGWMDQAAR